MTNILKKQPSDTDTNEVTDPQHQTGLNRKTIVIIGLALACLFTSVMLASNRSKKTPAPQSTMAEVADPTYGGVFSFPSEGLVEEPPPPPPASAVPAWASPMDDGYPVPGSEDEDSPAKRYRSAVKSGGLFYQAEKESLQMASATSTQPSHPTMTGDMVLLEGSTISAVLEQNIDSDRPGPVKARVLNDVTDSKTLTQVLIPAGTQVIGSMDMAGFSIALTWHRLIFPDGRSMLIDQLPSVDTGGGGVAGSVNRHRLARFGKATMAALIGATTAVAGAQLSESGGLFGSALALQLGQGGAGTMQQIIRPPTIKVPAGHRFDIWVQSDIQF
ncbi:MAG: TrbI/VirB10 family protein [Bacteroidetes bacterium]|nr:TrbI/VirB10 family protein [Bacteroidota bacterium]